MHTATIVVTVEPGSDKANIAVSFDPAITNDDSSNEAAGVALQMLKGSVPPAEDQE